MKKHYPCITTSIFMIFIGAMYNFVFPVIEQEVRVMGTIAIIIGLISLTFIPLYKNKYAGIFGIVFYFLISVLQILPIILWLSGSPVTDHPLAYQGNILFSISHVLILIISIWSIYSLKNHIK